MNWTLMYFVNSHKPRIGFGTRYVSVKPVKFAMCSRTRNVPGGHFTLPPPLPANVAKKPLPGEGLSIRCLDVSVLAERSTTH